MFDCILTILFLCIRLFVFVLCRDHIIDIITHICLIIQQSQKKQHFSYFQFLMSSSASSPDAATASSSPSASSSSPVHVTSLHWHVTSVTEDCLPQIHSLEQATYPADEACTWEKFVFRWKNANPFFKMAVIIKDKQQSSDNNKITTTTTASSTSSLSTASSVPTVLGFIVGTLSSSPTLTHDSMSQHDPAGEYLCIHSVVTAPVLQRRGIATKMMKDYITLIQTEQKHVRCILLICKQNLLSFYVDRCGFKLVGVSDVVHGQDQWFECRMELK